MKRVEYAKPKYIKNLSRELRANQTFAEKIFWEKIKNKQLWYKFLRQKPIYAFTDDDGNHRFYIADFYCHQKKLVIELDWSIHQEALVYKNDKRREEDLRKRNCHILRFTNNDVIDRMPTVLKIVSKKLKELPIAERTISPSLM